MAVQVLDWRELCRDDVASALCAGCGRAQLGYFVATSGAGRWHLTQDRADVAIAGNSFTAKLYQGGDVVLSIRGTINNGKVRAVVTPHASDDAPRKLAGSYRRTRWRDGPGGREAILLTEPDQPGGMTLGLTRELP